MDDQRKSSEWKGYGSLCKVYLAWVLFDPPASKRNAVVRYRIEGRLETTLHRPKTEDANLLEMVLIGIGDPNDAEFDESRALDALFFTGLSNEEYERIVREVFMLGSENDILRRGETMYWSMNEEFKNHWMEIGIEKGR